MGSPEQSDEALMERWVQGEAAAFDVLFERYAGRLLGLMRRSVSDPEVARELVQQTFVQLHRARHDYDPAKPLRPWLYTIARNVRRDWLRRRYRRPEGALVDAEPDDMRSTAPDQETAVRSRQVREAVARLPEGQRLVVELHWFEGLPFREVSEVTGVSYSAVKVRAHRAYKKLRDLLSGRPVTGSGSRANNHDED